MTHMKKLMQTKPKTLDNLAIVHAPPKPAASPTGYKRHAASRSLAGMSAPPRLFSHLKSLPAS
jgi:hypothetical protein